MASARPPTTSKELATAVYDDFKRKAIDEAKKRAVGQHVDYDTFKNMVLVAHLRPLQAPSQGRPDVMLPSWNFAADGTRMQQRVQELRLPACTPTQPPANSGDFARDWRRNCPGADDRYRYLKLCGSETLRTVFKVEISTDILREILSVLDTCWLSHAGAEEEEAGGGALREATFVTQVLEALTGAGRFTLTAKLLGSSAQPVLASLQKQLAAALEAAAAAGELVGSEEATSGDGSGSGGGVVQSNSLYTADQLAALFAAYGLKS